MSIPAESLVMRAPDSGSTASHRSPVEHWENRIRSYLQGAVENIIMAGTGLLEAKAALPHGDFGKLVEHLGLTRRTAQRFMAIARHPVLSNATRASHLPMAWTTLFELSKIEPEVLEAEMAAGTVTPQISRAEAAELGKRSDVDVDEVLSLSVAAIKQLEAVLQYLETADLDTADLVRWYTEVADIGRLAEGICAERVLRYELAVSALGDS